MIKFEKRAYARKRVDFEIRVVSATRSGTEIELPKEFRARGFEIAEAGCGIRCSHVFAPGDLLRVEIQLPGETRRLALTAQVRNLRRGNRASPAPEAFIGLRFAELSEEDRRYLGNYIGSTLLML